MIFHTGRYKLLVSVNSKERTKLIHSRLLFTFLAITIVIPATLLTYPTPTYASNISITPAAGIVGTTVHIDGNGFSGRLGTVSWDNQTTLTKIPINDAGELSFDFKIPTDYKGSHIIKITDDSNWTNSTASSAITILPSISIFPSASRSYSLITVIGNGFSRLEKDIKITWDKTVLPVSATANLLGAWSVTLEPPPDKGEYYISAFSSSTDASEIGEHKFIAGPFATMQPNSGPVGTEISIEAYGFRASEDGVTITLDNQIILCNLIAGTDGVLHTTLNIPPATQGHHLVGVFGSDFTPKGVIPAMDFNVVPNIELSPASGNKGTKVTINGTGFVKGELISLNFEGTSLNTNAIADDNGSFTSSFISPQSAVKENKVRAKGTNNNSAETLFVIEQVTPPAPTLIFPGQGDELHAFDSTGAVFLGAATQLFQMASFQDSKQPGISLSNVKFNWSDSNTQGEITYTLEIANGSDFSSPAISKSGLRESEYTLSKNDKLTIGSHSWRVVAEDNMGNQGTWSTPQEFEVIPMSNQVLIMALVILFVFIGAVASLGTILWRRHRSRR